LTQNATDLLAWYDAHHRSLPWRVTPPMAAQGHINNPYHVWLSEVMLQQTTVQAVKAYFAAFLERWPKVEDLAAADTDDVMKAWAGLGYYARARNLKKCAETVAFEHGGQFPDTEAGLRALPGIGDYTAAAIAAIAFNRRSAVLDANVERVIARLHAIRAPLPGARAQMRALVAEITPFERPGDFAQAMMDLGATVCTPKKPACGLCPLRDHCLAYRQGNAEDFPVKAAKLAKRRRVGAAFVARNVHGDVLLQRRAATGLLGGMSEVPGSPWTSRIDGETGVEAAPFAADWQACGTIAHVFTHFELQLHVYTAQVSNADTIATGNSAWWQPVAGLEGQALPTVMKKAITCAIKNAFSSVEEA
jgi:A/G-specific adenine glycosylase